MDGKRYDLGRFSSEKVIVYPLFGGFGGPLGRSGRGQKILPIARLDPRTLQPVAIRYIDHTIRTHAVMMNITAFRNVWSCNILDIYVRFGRIYCLHFQCGSGTCCSSLNFTGVLGTNFRVNLDQNTWGCVTKTPVLFDLTCEACGPFIVSYWCVVDLVHDI